LTWTDVVVVACTTVGDAGAFGFVAPVVGGAGAAPGACARADRRFASMSADDGPGFVVVIGRCSCATVPRAARCTGAGVASVATGVGVGATGRISHHAAAAAITIRIANKGNRLRRRRVVTTGLPNVGASPRRRCCSDFFRASRISDMVFLERNRMRTSGSHVLRCGASRRLESHALLLHS